MQSSSVNASKDPRAWAIPTLRPADFPWVWLRTYTSLRSAGRSSAASAVWSTTTISKESQSRVSRLAKHRRKSSGRIHGLLYELGYAVLFIKGEDTKAAGFLYRNLNRADGCIRIVFLVKCDQVIIVHLIDVIACQNQDEFRLLLPHKVDILVDRIGCASIPI